MKKSVFVVAVALAALSSPVFSDGVRVPQAPFLNCFPTYWNNGEAYYPMTPCWNGGGVSIDEGDIQLPYGGVIDFADYTKATPGPLAGYVFIRVQGQSYLMPYYNRH